MTFPVSQVFSYNLTLPVLQKKAASLKMFLLLGFFYHLQDFLHRSLIPHKQVLIITDSLQPQLLVEIL